MARTSSPALAISLRCSARLASLSLRARSVSSKHVLEVLSPACAAPPAAASRRTGSGQRAGQRRRPGSRPPGAAPASSGLTGFAAACALGRCGLIGRLLAPALSWLRGLEPLAPAAGPRLRTRRGRQDHEPSRNETISLCRDMEKLYCSNDQSITMAARPGQAYPSGDPADRIARSPRPVPATRATVPPARHARSLSRTRP